MPNSQTAFTPLPHYPGTYYKYRTIGKEGSATRARLRQIIVERELHHARPSTLNDLYDCNPYVLPLPLNKKRKFAERIVRDYARKAGPQQPRQNLNSKITRLVASYDNEINRNHVFYSQLDARVGVFCMSATCTSSLQWSYYGDSHCGVCLKFDIPEISDLKVVNVDYVESKLCVDMWQFPFDDAYLNELLDRVVRTKSLDWQHEQEFRSIKWKEGTIKLRPGVLTGVVYGAATPPDQIDFVDSLIAESESNFSREKCFLRHNDFGLDVRPILREGNTAAAPLGVPD